MDNDPNAPETNAKTLRRDFLKLAAVVPLVGTSLLIPQSSPQPPGILWQAKFSTQPGQWLEVKLHDGTKAKLSPRTTIICRFDGRRRFVSLLAGDLALEIVEDLLRPFIVESFLGRARVLRAASCAFSHEPKRRSVVTAVTGNVVVSRREDMREHNSMEIVSGQQIIIEPLGPLRRQSVNLTHALAWTEKKAVFILESVEQAIYQFNRVNEIALSVPDYPSVKTFRVTGTFPLDRPEWFLRDLERRLK